MTVGGRKSEGVTWWRIERIDLSAHGQDQRGQMKDYWTWSASCPTFLEGRVGGGHDLYCEGSCKGAGRRTAPGGEGLLSCELSDPAASMLCSTQLYIVTCITYGMESQVSTLVYPCSLCGQGTAHQYRQGWENNQGSAPLPGQNMAQPNMYKVYTGHQSLCYAWTPSTCSSTRPFFILST